ncbi:MAG: hypothetical protein ACNI22_12300 [Halarcobacter sp.]
MYYSIIGFLGKAEEKRRKAYFEKASKYFLVGVSKEDKKLDLNL